MKRRCFLKAAGAAAATLPQVASAAGRSARPNLVFILADDLGYGDLGCYGCPDIGTPRLDRLASEGARLTDCYSSASVCSPTRAAFLTGRYPQRIGLEWAVYYGVPEEGLPPAETSLARMLGDAGYATALSGKWHLGYGDWAPTRHGFDRFFGMLGGNVHYFEHYDRIGKPDLWLDGRPARMEGYATDLIADHAVKFIDAMAARPFFLYVPFTAPHFPYQGPGDARREVTPRRGWQSGTRATYATMVESLDACVGRIVDALDRRGLRERTLVVFTSDNGGAGPGRNAPMAKGKGTLWEGGIRVPGIVRWPGTVPAAQRSGQVVTTFDFAAAFAALAGARPPANRPFDGIDPTPVLTGRGPARNRTLFWRRALDPYRSNVQPHRAVRHGAWKYIDRPTGERYMFDLAADPRETTNLAEAQPAVANDLRRRLDQWESQVDPPLYDQRAAALRKRRARRKGR